ncbi:MAG: hypothetical protein IPP91_10555 [Betaproteobacteria bacterium]|nr:hypothetical protein [Betaproteobacteria bacterium]
MDLEDSPGRSCPTTYRYSPRSFDRPAQIEAETFYVVGGLYGNVESLDEIVAMAARETHAVKVVFNGDFHWFDTAADDFHRLSEEVSRHAAIRGNVETEIAGEDSGAGCGCAYPADVTDTEVMRSNKILERLRETAREHPAAREALARLPMHLVARVGDARVGIVHGDCASLAGWGFAQPALDDPGQRRWLENSFADARVDLFASSHTCQPALRSFDFGSGPVAVANNGAAGMPNFAGEHFGVLTRISVHPADQSLYGTRIAGAFVDALAIRYDAPAWERRFLASWPEGSSAHQSYFRRIASGTGFPRTLALRIAA